MKKELSRGEKVVAFIETYCRVPEGALVGKPVKLDPFQKNFILDVYDNEHVTDTAILSIARKNGKALKLDTPIPTPTGWTTMGDLTVGDTIFDEMGNHTKVTFVTPTQYNRDCYSVEFANGEKIVADADHQWTVNVKKSSRKKDSKTLTTKDMLNDFNVVDGRGHNNFTYSVDITKPIVGEDKDLLIGAYTLGYWLGNGNSDSSCIYMDDTDSEENISNIEAEGYKPYKTKFKFEWSLGKHVRNENLFVAELRAEGVFNNKHIPMKYLRASVETRKTLLQGLMDSDGYASKTGQCELTLTLEPLAKDALSLIRSLGFKACIKPSPAKLYGRETSTRYRITFFCTKENSCFKLPRKTARLKDELSNRNKVNSIVNITPVESVPVRCITVDSPNSLFLAGEGYTPTHNTALIAGILLAHLIGPEAVKNSQIISGATSRDQAAIVFNLAVKMINLNPVLKPLVHIVPSTKKLIGRAKNVEYKALSADGRTAHGLSPILAIIDELGQVRGPQDDFVDAIVTAQGAHETPLLMTISTQAPTDADLLSIWIDDALKPENKKAVCHLYAADQEAGVTDEEAWKAANPALGTFRSYDDMAKMADKANRMPSFENTFRNLNLNQRVSTVSPFVSRNVWEGCFASNFPRIEDCDEVWAGLDLSARTDLTACVFVGRYDGNLFVYPYIFTPEDGLVDRARTDRVPYDVWVRQGHMFTTPGKTVDYRYVAKAINDVVVTLKNFKTIAFDRWRIDVFNNACIDLGITLDMTPFGQGYKDMSPAVDALEAELLNSRIYHNGNPCLTMAAANAVVVKDAAGGRKLDKTKSTNRIDPFVAMTMAVGVANQAIEAEPDYGVYVM